MTNIETKGKTNKEKINKLKKKTSKMIRDTLSVKELSFSYSPLKTGKEKSQMLYVESKKNVLQNKIILNICDRFRKFRNSDKFKIIGARGNEQVVLNLDNALKFLSNKLTEQKSKEIPQLIARAYRMANNPLLGKTIQTEICINKEHIKQKGNYMDIDLPSNICRLALAPKAKVMPFAVRNIIANCVKWGLEYAKDAAITGRSVDVNESLTPASIEFRMLIAERKRLEKSKKAEIAYLERKIPGVLKFFNQEQINKKSSMMKILNSSNKDIKRRKKASKVVRKFRDYRLPTEQVAYEKLCLFYDEKFKRVEDKFNNLIRKQTNRIKYGEIGGIFDHILFKNSIWEAVDKQTIHHMNALRNIVDDYEFSSVIPPENDEVGNIVYNLKSFSKEALDLVWNI